MKKFIKNPSFYTVFSLAFLICILLFITYKDEPGGLIVVSIGTLLIFCQFIFGIYMLK